MSRFFGNAVFEGMEVSDEDYARLTQLRSDEMTAIRNIEDERRNRIASLHKWAEEGIMRIKAEEERHIAEIIKDVNDWIERTHESARVAIAHIRDEEAKEVATAERWGDDQIHKTRAAASTAIADVKDEEAHEIAATEKWAEDEIAAVHRVTQERIDGIVATRIIEPVYEVQGESTACEYCRAKIGTIGTMEMLAAQDCVPPFHENCKCWLEEIGYCIL